MAFALQGLGLLALAVGDAARAEAILVQGLTVAEGAGDGVAAYVLQMWLGNLALVRRDHDGAERLLERALAATREHGDRWTSGIVLGSLGRVALARGDRARAASLLLESMADARAFADADGIAHCLDGLGEIDLAVGDAAQATRLFAASAALRERTGASPLLPWAAEREQAVATARVTLGDEPFELAWSAGHGRGLEAALAEAAEAARRHRAEDSSELSSGAAARAR